MKAELKLVVVLYSRAREELVFICPLFRLYITIECEGLYKYIFFFFDNYDCFLFCWVRVLAVTDRFKPFSDIDVQELSKYFS